MIITFRWRYGREYFAKCKVPRGIPEGKKPKLTIVKDCYIWPKKTKT